uniref:Uncharacterized protein n=1 Tax=Caenorhabditis japonica TaxID=281687 RepID=A0A8R1EGW0_CAEJA
MLHPGVDMHMTTYWDRPLASSSACSSGYMASGADFYSVAFGNILSNSSSSSSSISSVEMASSSSDRKPVVGRLQMVGEGSLELGR